jgi:hypothetical protein
MTNVCTFKDLPVGALFRRVTSDAEPGYTYQKVQRSDLYNATVPGQNLYCVVSSDAPVLLVNADQIRLDAEALDVAPDDYLWCISCFTGEHPAARLREAPSSLTLDALYRVAYSLGVDIDVQIVVPEKA